MDTVTVTKRQERILSRSDACPLILYVNILRGPYLPGAEPDVGHTTKLNQLLTLHAPRWRQVQFSTIPPGFTFPTKRLTIEHMNISSYDYNDDIKKSIRTQNGVCRDQRDGSTWDPIHICTSMGKSPASTYETYIQRLAKDTTAMYKLTGTRHLNNPYFHWLEWRRWRRRRPWHRRPPNHSTNRSCPELYFCKHWSQLGFNLEQPNITRSLSAYAKSSLTRSGAFFCYTILFADVGQVQMHYSLSSDWRHIWFTGLRIPMARVARRLSNWTYKLISGFGALTQDSTLIPCLTKLTVLVDI